MASQSFADLMAQAQEAGYGPDVLLPKGKYDAEVVLANFKRSSKGKFGLGIKFKVNGGPHDGAGVWTNLYLSPESAAALAIFFRDLATLGVTAEDIANLDPDNDTHGERIAALIEEVGASVQITVAVGEFQGEDKNEVKRIAPPKSGPRVARDDAAGDDSGGDAPAQSPRRGPRSPF